MSFFRSKRQGCISEGENCRADGQIGYCCKGYCLQFPGEISGVCALLGNTPSTSGPSATSSSSASSTGSATATSSATTYLGCLGHGEPCDANGSMGICCSGNCQQLAGQPHGWCLGSSPPTNLPPKCLSGGANCTSSGSLGWCCSRQCNVLWPHRLGTCAYTEEELRAANGKDDPGNTWIIATFASLAVVILIVIALVWLYRRQRRLEKVLSQKETDQFFYGDPEHAQLNGYAHENVDNFPYNKEQWEIDESDFSIDWESILGSGCYGLVVKGKVNGKDVAVKTVRNQMANGTHLRALLSEIKVLQYIGKFDYIVNMVGSNTSSLENGKVYLFLEFCPLGSLEKYLRSNKYNFQNDLAKSIEFDDSNSYVNTTASVGKTESGIKASELMTWCLQITDAMRFLASKKVIHADLATRNVLLQRKDCAKLTDFGLSRRLYEYSSYVKRHQEPLPWRHMALEALQQLSFSHKSDVWSLGITFWEIFTLGDVPYPGLSWTPEFVSHLENNLRPAKPLNASDEMYDVMLDCWKPIPDTRPNFDDIYQRLRNQSKWKGNEEALKSST